MLDIPGERDWRALVADVERAATPRGRFRLGCYSIEGIRLHERALRAGAPLTAVLLDEQLRRNPTNRVASLLAGLESAGCPLRFAPGAEMARLTEGRGTGALIGLVRLPEPPPLEVLVGRGSRRPISILVAVDVDDPGNVGALVRTALAAGAAAYVGVGPGDPFHPRAVRTSMGALFKIPLLRFEAADPLLEALRSEEIRSVGAVTRGGTPLPDADLSGPAVALFVGSEAFGLDGELSRRLDERVTIPMESEVDSYSVNAAAAILLHAIRQARA